MAHALALDSRDIALDLHGLLRDLDPARWQDEVEVAMRARATEIQAEVQTLQAKFDELRETYTDQSLAALGEALDAIDARFDRLSELLDEYTPQTDLSVPDLRKEWMDFRVRLQPAYEGLAESLRVASIHVPSLRPTNYARNIFHVSSALLALVLVETVLTPMWMFMAALAVASSAWLMELGKRSNPRVDRITWFVFGKMGHPYERTRVNSATWFSSALLVLSLTGSQLIAALALMILGVADPAAGLIGRRIGRHKLVHGRSVEGTAAFVLFGAVGCLITLAIFHPALGLPLALGITAAAVLPAALAELYAYRIDDNLLVPMAAAAGAGAFALLVGIPL